MLRVFPQLARTRIDHAWGGTLGITPTRMPFVCELEHGFINGSGFSGKGVVLAPYIGKTIAEAILGRGEELEWLSHLRGPAFPGGARWRGPLLLAGMSVAALLDRL
jgi:gamma-glutamylputrescine oxidase